MGIGLVGLMTRSMRPVANSGCVASLDLGLGLGLGEVDGVDEDVRCAMCPPVGLYASMLLHLKAALL